MYSLEFSTTRPAGTAPYFSLVVRDEPYIVGCLPQQCDVVLPCSDISSNHASLKVMRMSKARKLHQTDASEVAHDEGPLTTETNGAIPFSTRTDIDSADISKPWQLVENDPLVVELTASLSMGIGEILVHGHPVMTGHSVLIEDRTRVEIGSQAVLIFRYRPLVVSIRPTAFDLNYADDLVAMFREFGATLCDLSGGTAWDLSRLPTPVGLLHCTEELNDERDNLQALTMGFSIVQPTYVFEWFAALAQKPSSTLSVLPPPSKYKVPIRCLGGIKTFKYTRPEPETCPFALFPFPSTVMERRHRGSLFKGKVFYFAVEASWGKYKDIVMRCGAAAAYGPDSAGTATEAIRRLVAAQSTTESGKPTPVHEIDGDDVSPFPVDFYIILDATAAVTVQKDGLQTALPDLFRFIDGARSMNARHIPILTDQSLFASLLSCEFISNSLEHFVKPPVLNLQPSLLSRLSTRTAPRESAQQTNPRSATPYQDGYYHSYTDSKLTPTEGATTISPTRSDAECNDVSVTLRSLASEAPVVKRQKSSSRIRPSQRRVASASQVFQENLLPFAEHRTPTRSQIRVSSRHRAHSSSAMPTSDQPSQPPSPSSARHGRRHLLDQPSLTTTGLSVEARFNILRIRIYAYLIHTDAKLEDAIVVYQRGHYVAQESMEYALESLAQAEDFMEQVNTLLEACGVSSIADSLQRFWKDCYRLAAKARRVLDFWRFKSRHGAPRVASDPASASHPPDPRLFPHRASAEDPLPGPRAEAHGAPASARPRRPTPQPPHAAPRARAHPEAYLSSPTAARSPFRPTTSPRASLRPLPGQPPTAPPQKASDGVPAQASGRPSRRQSPRASGAPNGAGLPDAPHPPRGASATGKPALLDRRHSARRRERH